MNLVRWQVARQNADMVNNRIRQLVCQCGRANALAWIRAKRSARVFWNHGITRGVCGETGCVDKITPGTQSPGQHATLRVVGPVPSRVFDERQGQMGQAFGSRRNDSKGHFRIVPLISSARITPRGLIFQFGSF